MRIIIILFVLTSNVVLSQKFNRKYFLKTQWFTNNLDSNFYKADTVRFVQYKNISPSWSYHSPENEYDYLKHANFVTLAFKKHNFLSFAEIYNNYKGVTPIIPWTWKFERKSKLLNIYNHKNEIVVSFKPISEREIKIKSEFAIQKDLLTTTELTLIRVK